MNAIGLDLSLTASGIASSTGWCQVVGRKGLTVATTPLAVRVAGLRELKQELLDIIGTPAIACIETPALSKSRGGVFERGLLWFAVVGVLIDRGVPVVEVGPGQLKLYATGSGRAKKGEVADAVTRRWPQFMHRGDDNMADAAVLSAIGAELLGEPLAAMPAVNRAALAKLRLPEGLAA